MTATLGHLQDWLSANEDEHLEFKEAKNNFHFDKLVKYCAALANEGGGSIILGVSDSKPRRVVGTQAFDDLSRTKAGLIERLRLRVEVGELAHSDGRVLVFTCPPRPIGVPIPVEGAYYMRGGEDLVSMTPDALKRIFAESGPDFSAEVCAKATLQDIDPEAIEEFRRLWQRRSTNAALHRASPEQLLRDAELMTESGVTFAALVLLGTHAAMGRHLAQAEVVFEYRSSEAPGPANQREEFRQGFLRYYDRLWELVNLRNDRQHYQDGLFMVDIPTFNEGAVREAILNAVAHRDYRHAGSVFIRQFPRRIEIVSPGGFPAGITPENILDRQQPRNRRIADAFGRCGLVERAGQGANRIYEACIREGKPLPDFTNTDGWQVSLTMHGQVDSRFVRFLERLGKSTGASFDTHEFLLFDLVHREQPVPQALAAHAPRLVELGALERIGRGRGARYVLSRRFAAAIGQAGTYTRRRGLDRAQNKELLVQHLRENPQAGSPMAVLQQVLPGLSRAEIKRLLDDLRRNGRVQLVGKARSARWTLCGGTLPSMPDHLAEKSQ